MSLDDFRRQRGSGFFFIDLLYGLLVIFGGRLGSDL
jgi:hypothetical protein